MQGIRTAWAVPLLALGLAGCSAKVEGSRKARNFCAEIRPGDPMSTIEARARDAGAIMAQSKWDMSAEQRTDSPRIFRATFLQEQDRYHVCQITSDAKQRDVVAKAESMVTTDPP